MLTDIVRFVNERKKMKYVYKNLKENSVFVRWT